MTIPQGQLSGIRVSTGILQPNFWAFRGIPYAGNHHYLNLIHYFTYGN